MNPVTLEWITKAEGDWTSAQRELRARKNPNYDACCFHAEQCAEKYLKARLHHGGTRFPQTHNLLALLDLCLASEPSWELLRPLLTTLNVLSVSVRYPGVTADRALAREAVEACRTLVRRSLGLE